MSDPVLPSHSALAERPFPLPVRWLSARALLVLMLTLQLAWIGVIWFTGAAVAAHKLLPLTGLTLVLGTAVLLLPERFFAWLPLEAGRLEQGETRWLLLLGLVVAIILLIFAAQQRIWAFDEEGNLMASITVAKNGIQDLFANYGRRPWLGKQHPPLAPIIYGTSMRFLGTTQLAGRIVSILFSLGTGVVTYLIGRRLFDRQTAFLGAALLFSFPLVFRLGAAAMVEMQLTFFFSLSVLLALRLAERPSASRLLLVGLAVGAGLLSKYTMVLGLPLMFGIIAIQGSFQQAVRYFGILALVSLALLAGWLLLANQLDVLQQQLATIWEYAGLVLTNEYGRRVLLETVTNRLPSGLGVYNLPLLALGALVLLHRRQAAEWVVLLWISSVWLLLFLTLPDHRYFLPTFPAAALTAALGLQQIPKATAKGLLLALFLAGSSLYLYVDWVRSAELFVK